MNDFISSESRKYKDLYVAADTSCGKFQSLQYISQGALDKVSYDFYNIILFKKENTEVICRIIETDESKNFNSICKSFFK